MGERYAGRLGVAMKKMGAKNRHSKTESSPLCESRADHRTNKLTGAIPKSWMTVGRAPQTVPLFFDFLHKKTMTS